MGTVVKKLSYPAGNFDFMNLPAASLEALLAIMVREGFTICETHLPAGLWGACDTPHHRIYIEDRLTEGQRRAALAHELIHARRGDTGHQNSGVEDRVNRMAARLLIPDSDYEQAERVAGPNPAAIASELGLPRFLIDAWRRDHSHLIARANF